MKRPHDTLRYIRYKWAHDVNMSEVERELLKLEINRIKSNFRMFVLFEPLNSLL